MDDKRDWLIAIVVFIILVLLFSMQSILPNDDAQRDKDCVAIGGCEEVSDDNGDLVLPGVGDVSVDIRFEDTKSPQTGYY